MYHYTYLIQHRTEDKRYIGVRSSKCLPQEDLTYWGSSKYLPKDVKETHVKIVLKEFATRSEAVEHEILLHKLNNVAVSENYYNKACQKTSGFDTSGTKLTFTDEHKRKISEGLKGYVRTKEHKRNNSIAQKALYSNGYINPRQGIVMDEKLKRKISQHHIDSGLGLSITNVRFKPWFIINAEGIKTIYSDITKEDQSIKDGHRSACYQDIYTKSKGVRPMKFGKFKDFIIGNC